MTTRVADCYFWIQAYYILLGHEICAGLFKKGFCHICKKEAVYDSQKKNTRRRITVCCTETWSKNSLSSKQRSCTEKYSVIWSWKNFRIITTVIIYWQNQFTKIKNVMPIIMLTLKAILVLLWISFSVTVWKPIKLFPWRHWQVYITWSKGMIADTATSWKWSWKTGIEFSNLLFVNNFSSSRIVNAKLIVFRHDWELKPFCNSAHWTLGWQ